MFHTHVRTPLATNTHGHRDTNIGLPNTPIFSIVDILNMSKKLHQVSLVAGRSRPHVFDAVQLIRSEQGHFGSGIDWKSWKSLLTKYKEINTGEEALTFIHGSTALIDDQGDSSLLNIKSPSILHMSPAVSSQDISSRFKIPVNMAQSTDLYGPNVPPFPAVHTYRQTMIPVTRTLHQSKIVIQTCSEKLKLEKNLRRLLQFSQAGPASLHYDDQCH